jgi:hypothetical protein
MSEYDKVLLLIDALNKTIQENNYGKITGAEYAEELGCFGLRDLDRENMLYDLRKFLDCYLDPILKISGEIRDAKKSVTKQQFLESL